MTDPGMVVCRRCGFSNVPGDQFCGSCGAFLEWEGQAAPPATAADGGTSPATAVTPMTPTTVPVPPLAPPPPQAWQPPPVVAAPAAAIKAATPTPAPVAAPVPVAMDAIPADDSADGLLRCPACGIANPATRTFCQSCGTRLGDAARVAEPTADQIAAAVAAPPRTTSVASAVGAASPRAAAPPSRRFPTLIVAIAGLGILVGVLAVVAGLLLGGKAPPTGATAGPSSVAVGSPGRSGAAGASPGASAAGGTGAVPLSLTATASSVVGNRDKFQPEKAIDGDLTTSWQEGAKTEKGEWIEVAFAPSRADSVVIRNGYQASTPLYKGNLRLKDILVSVDGRPGIAARLADSTKPQTIGLGGVAGATTVRITIVSTYPSTKTSIAGTPFDDAAVSEIAVLGVPGG